MELWLTFHRAVLTKYTAVRSFLEAMPGVNPLDYDNTGIYMADLLDAYMEWKSLWSQVNKIMEGPHKYEAREDPNTAVEEEQSDEASVEAAAEDEESAAAPVVKKEKPAPSITDKPIGIALAELDKAKTFCRQQMLKILKEVRLMDRVIPVACTNGAI